MLLGGSSAPRSPAGVWCSPPGAVGSPGRSFPAYHEVDGAAEVFLGAGDVGSVPDGDRFFPDYVFYVYGEY